MDMWGCLHNIYTNLLTPWTVYMPFFVRNTYIKTTNYTDYYIQQKKHTLYSHFTFTLNYPQPQSHNPKPARYSQSQRVAQQFQFKTLKSTRSHRNLPQPAIIQFNWSSLALFFLKLKLKLNIM